MDTRTQALSLRWVRTGTVTWRSRPGEGPPSAPPVVTTPLMSNSVLLLKSYIENNIWLLSGCCYISHRLCQLTHLDFLLTSWCTEQPAAVHAWSLPPPLDTVSSVWSWSQYLSLFQWTFEFLWMSWWLAAKNKATSKSKSWGGFCKIKEEAWKIDSFDLFSLHI